MVLHIFVLALQEAWKKPYNSLEKRFIRPRKNRALNWIVFCKCTSSMTLLWAGSIKVWSAFSTLDVLLCWNGAHASHMCLPWVRANTYNKANMLRFSFWQSYAQSSTCACLLWHVKILPWLFLYDSGISLLHFTLHSRSLISTHMFTQCRFNFSTCSQFLRHSHIMRCPFRASLNQAFSTRILKHLAKKATTPGLKLYESFKFMLKQ